ncbi:hypothetical protein Tco_0741288 [Tanacetum coccineum]
MDGRTKKVLFHSWMNGSYNKRRMDSSILNNKEWKESDCGNPLYTTTDSFFKAHDEHDIGKGNVLRQIKCKEDNKNDEQPNKRVCKAKKFEDIKYSLGPKEEYVAIRRCEYNVWERNEYCMSQIYQENFQKKDNGWKVSQYSVFQFMDTAYWSPEYNYGVLGKDWQKGSILELKRRNMKITVLTSNTPYPSRKIRRICVCTSLKTTKDQGLIRCIQRNLYAVFKLWNLFKALSLDEVRSSKFYLFYDLEEYSEEEVAKIMAETMEQYMSKTRADYGSRIARPKIDDKDHFELKGQFLKELRDNTFSGSDHEDANVHIEKVLEIVDLFLIVQIWARSGYDEIEEYFG